MSKDDDKPDFSPGEWQPAPPDADWLGPRGLPVTDSADLTRVLNLPRRPVVTEGSATAAAYVQLMMQRYSRGPRACNCRAMAPERFLDGRDGCLHTLLWQQAWMLYEMGVANGMIAAMSTGVGKTLVFLLSALAIRNCRLALLLIPPALTGQIMEDYLLVAEHFRVPNIAVHRGERQTQEGPIQRRPDGSLEPTLHVLPYSRLSSVRSSEWIEHLRPDLIIADECFPGDTLVDTDEGPLRIADVVDIGLGTLALSYDKHTRRQVWKRITRRMRRPGTKQLVRVTHADGAFTCTEDHRIWTENRGYVEAKSLAPTDELRLRVVPSAFQARGIHEEVLQQGVWLCGACTEAVGGIRAEARRRSCDRNTQLCEMWHCLQSSGLRSNTPLQCLVFETKTTEGTAALCNLRQTCDRASEILQRYVQAAGPETSTEERSSCSHTRMPQMRQAVYNTQSEDDALLSRLRHQPSNARQATSRLLSPPAHNAVRIQREPGSAPRSSGEVEGSHIPVERRERHTHRTATGVARRAWTGRLRDGVRDTDSSSSSEIRVSTPMLQGGFGISTRATGDRGGRQNTSHEALEISRQTEDFGAQRSRVVCVEVLEQGSARGYSSGSGEDPVYDLTVEDTHCYYANGVLVSNCDSLASLQSARTLRVMRHYQQHGDTTRFVCGTGTLTDSELTEFAHLAALALRWGSPLPLDPQVTQEWNQCLGAVPSPCPPGALLRLLEPGQPVSELRQAFRRRLAETPGFVMVSGRQVVVSPTSGEEIKLSVTERRAPSIPAIVQKALEMVRDNIRPDTLVGGEQDEILADAKDQIRCAREVACGLFYKFEYPNGEPRELQFQWREARKLWNQELLRKRLQGEAHLDSAKLCENAARRAWGDDPKNPLLPEWRAENWPRWRDIMDRVHPVTVAVRLDPFLVDDTVQWALENHGIVWYTISEAARWMAQRARELHGRDLTVYGAATGDTLISQARHDNRSIIASLDAHGRGRDKLQFLFSTQLFFNCPSSDKRWQQALARQHRRGQTTDVKSFVYQHTTELQKALQQAFRRGEYVRDVTGEDRKLLDAWED